MINPSLVDYILQRGNKDYGEFASRTQINNTNNDTIFNHRKMLEYLFASEDGQQNKRKNYDNDGEKIRESSSVAPGKSISDLKAQEISGQLEYFSGKIHSELSRKHLTIDSDLYKLEGQWAKKKIPDFYCYYFLKFAYANSFSRLHELVLSETEHMSKEKNSYMIICKTIEARQVCMVNLRKQLTKLTEEDIVESLITIKEEIQMKKNIKRQNNKKHQVESKGYKKTSQRDAAKNEETGKSWKNKLQLIFENVEHMRKLSCYVVELVKNWKTSIYNISEDPRRYRQRVIFFHHSANYLLKMLWDCNFIKQSVLSKYIKFATHFDPFIIKPIMVIENKPQSKRNDQEEIFLSLIKPSQTDMDKIVKCLIVLAEEQYDEDQQSRFLNQKKNYGELEIRKKFFEGKRDIGKKSSAVGQGAGNRQGSETGRVQTQKSSYSENKHFRTHQQQQSPKDQLVREKKAISSSRLHQSQNDKLLSVHFASNKKSDNLPRQIQEVNTQRKQLNKRPVSLTALGRIKKIRTTDLKKISPYLSRNQFLKKAQQVVEYEHKFRVAHNEYLQSVKSGTNKLASGSGPRSNSKDNSNPNGMKTARDQQNVEEIVQQNRELSNNRIFNKYIQENMRMAEQANKKAFLYKNKVPQKTKNLVHIQDLNYNNNSNNKVSFHDRKQAQYQRNLQKYTMPRNDPEYNATTPQRRNRKASASLTNPNIVKKQIDLKQQQKNLRSPSRQRRTIQMYGLQQTRDYAETKARAQGSNPNMNSMPNIKINASNTYANGYSPTKNTNKIKGTKAIIEISEKGVRASQMATEYQLTGKKGKNLGSILENHENATLSNTLRDRLSTKKQLTQRKKKQSTATIANQSSKNQINLFQSQQRSQIIVLRQQPQKLQQLKKSLYLQIKQELMQQLKNSQTKKQQDLNQMIEQEKQRKLQQIIQQRREQQHRKRMDQQRMRIAQLQKQRKKIDIPIWLECCQYGEESVSQEWFQKQLFFNNKEIYERLFTNEKVDDIEKGLMDQLHVVFLRGYASQQTKNQKLHQPNDPQQTPVSFCSLSYDWTASNINRKFIIKYLSTTQVLYYISTFHQVCQYMWKNDPVQQIEIVLYDNAQNQEGSRIVQDIRQYCERNGQVYERSIYSNVTEVRGVVFRPSGERRKGQGKGKRKMTEEKQLSQQEEVEGSQEQQKIKEAKQDKESNDDDNQLLHRQAIQQKFPYTSYQFGNFFSMKTQLLSVAISLVERRQPKIDMNLQVYTNYIFLLEELFRSYLTPEEIVELRENSTNIRRLKDIFRCVLELEQTNPKINELTIVEGLNLDDLYSKIKEKIIKSEDNNNDSLGDSGYDKYYWDHFYDKTPDNRLLLAILQTKLEIAFPMNGCWMAERRCFRINVRSKILTLKSSVYSKQDIYILPTNNPKIRIFLMQGQNYKLMRIELFIFLNLVFNNIVNDSETYVNSLWVPQFSIAQNDGDKVTKRITDFSISMKKSFFLSEQTYFCNNQYIKNGYSSVPKSNGDILFRESMVIGLLHTDIEKSSTGMPIYAKLIDRDEFFVNKENK